MRKVEVVHMCGETGRIPAQIDRTNEAGGGASKDDTIA